MDKETLLVFFFALKIYVIEGLCKFSGNFLRRKFLISIKEAMMEGGDKNYSSCAFQAKSLLNL